MVYTITTIHSTAAGAIGFQLPVDPFLSFGPTLPPLTSVTNDDLQPSTSSGTLTVINEGLPPLPTKLVEQIRRWEYVDLAQLLDDHRQPVGFTFQPSTGGQILVIDQDHVPMNSVVVNRLQIFSHG